ncbi:DNA-binding NtrC family response regulator [Clostridium beijerinckii]|nr:DNA-binding NtrC family response regulator [Clostridium beijerinckii]
MKKEYKILIIDDEEEILLSLKRILYLKDTMWRHAMIQ